MAVCVLQFRLKRALYPLNFYGLFITINQPVVFLVHASHLFKRLNIKRGQYLYFLMDRILKGGMMCWKCTEKITTGERYLSEYIIIEQMENSIKGWKTIRVDADGVEASILLPLKPVCGLLEPNHRSFESLKERASSNFTQEELARLIEIYHSEPLQLERLFSLRHPLRKEVPYFRQVWPIKGGILIGNTFSFPLAGTVKLLGSSEKLAGIVQKILEAQLQPAGGDWQNEASGFFCRSKFWLGDARELERLILAGGIVKTMGNYAFAVAKTGDFSEYFCATNSPKMVADAVKMKLDSM